LREAKLILLLFFCFARFRDGKDDAAAGSADAGYDPRQAAKVRVSQPLHAYYANWDFVHGFMLLLFDSAGRIRTACLLSRWILRR
jgi:hypothetical protein